MSALAVGAVLCIASGMWLHFRIKDAKALARLPVAEQMEVQSLVEDPHRDERRLWRLFEKHYEIDNFLPGLRNPDWFALLVLLLSSIPFIFAFGFIISASLARQFTDVASAAKKVAHGDFSARAKVSPKSPGELIGLAEDFNEMSGRLEKNEREIRESSAMLAHELRTPLNAAMGRVQGMLDGVFARSDEQLSLVHKQLDQINRIVADIHLLSMARAGRLHLERHAFSLLELLEERIRWIERDLVKLGIQWSVDCQSQQLVDADRHRIGQVLSILMDNLLKYAAVGKSMEVAIAGDEESVVLTVADRGPGLSLPEIVRVGDRFWRAEDSRARHSGGSGLGLAIAGAICLAHGGELQVLARDGGGLKVRVTLPRFGALQAARWH